MSSKKALNVHYNIHVHLRLFARNLIYSTSKNTHSGAGRGATQIFDLIRGTCVKTVAEQSALSRRECDALQLTAGEEGVA